MDKVVKPWHENVAHETSRLQTKPKLSTIKCSRTQKRAKTEEEKSDAKLCTSFVVSRNTKYFGR